MRKLLLLSFMLMLAGLMSLAQQRTVTGKVTDDKGSPVPGASVVIKSTRTGTVTKDDGTFSLTVPPDARTLVISAIGMAPQEATIGTQPLAVALRTATNQTMQEV